MREVHRLPGRGARPARLAAWLVLVSAVAGCSSKYAPVKVSGTVTLDGEPVENATVFFYAVGDEREGRPASGITDKDGEFRLSTMGKDDGALRREYKVVIHKYVPTLPNLKMPDFPDTVEGRAEKADWRYRNFEAKGIQPFTNSLPSRYGDTNSTPLSCNVTEETTVKFELTTK
jgi:hypothetical protein